MREMGQSAWLSTSLYNLQGTEGQSQCEESRLSGLSGQSGPSGKLRSSKQST